MNDQENRGGDVESPLRDMTDIPPDEQARELSAEAEDVHVDPDEPAESYAERRAQVARVRQWRVAKSLLKLREQVNARAPNRNKASDGTIGDRRHCGEGAPSSSDHCPWVTDGNGGVVTAMDITHDPAGGCDAGALAQSIVDARDDRVKYVISNRRIASSSSMDGKPPWTWRLYDKPNPHIKHCHISVKSQKASYDSTDTWNIDLTS